MAFRIAVTDDWQSVASACADWSRLAGRADVTFFADALKPADAVETLASYDVILPMRERMFFPATLLRSLPKLKMFALTGNSARILDLATCNERGILCCWSGEYRPANTAEYTLGLILAAERDIAKGDAIMRAGGFQAGTRLGRALNGATLGLVGFGNIGKLVTRYTRALGMTVLAWSPSLTAERARADGAEAAGFDELVTRSDIVSIHVTLKPETRDLIDARALRQMKQGALLVNTSRGPIVNEAALVEALNAGRIRAALDVFDEEPLPADHALRSTPGTLLSPHLGFSTWDCYEAFYQDCLDNIIAFLDGKPQRVLNPEALARR